MGQYLGGVFQHNEVRNAHGASQGNLKWVWVELTLNLKVPSNARLVQRFIQVRGW